MQVIYYGAPGTGKSYEIDRRIKDRGIDDEYVFRTTFHPEFTYSDFVGQLLPTVVKSGPKAGDITYDFSKGVFTLALEKAYEDTSKDVYLILEEMSRGNCAAIFGDIFQLLDREKSGIREGYSKYFINNEMMARDIVALKDDRVTLPPNLSIFGTVNTSDQNVFVMDTAFKRRFEWKYISTRPKPAKKPYENNVELTICTDHGLETITWVDFYGVLNKFVTGERWLELGEDKQLGQFFVEFDPLGTAADHKEQFKDKLLQYLWNDIHKASFKSGIQLFDRSVSNFSDLYDRFEADEKVFSDEFLKCVELWRVNSL